VQDKRARRWVDRPSEIGLVEVAAREALGQKVFLRPIGPANAPSEWRLSSSQAPLDAAGASTPVVSLLEAAGWFYWLSMQLKFTSLQGELRFRSASITILRSALASGDKTSLLRAEWEYRDGQEHRKHGQPHWHVYVSEPKLHGDVERFHLAMAACWHLGETESHFREPSPQGVARWVGECIKYIRFQASSVGRVAQSVPSR
jgi:hypothetical protein